ncbi:MAG: type IV secretion system protein TraC [Nitrospirae bacterium]|nr:MAG: type IV secretion system protein TraC [Nitrospirota bacterium]
MSVPIYQANKLLDRYSFSEFLFYRAYDAERRAFWLADGRIGVVWKAHPLPGCDVQELGLLHGIFEQDFPPGTTLQIQHLGSRAIEPILDGYVELRPKTSENPQDSQDSSHTREALFRTMAEREREFILNARDIGIVPATRMRPRTHELIISMTVPVAWEHQRGVSEDVALEHCSSVESMLETIWKNWVRRLDAGEFRRLLLELLNPGHNLREFSKDYDPKIPLNEQVIAYDNAIVVRDGMIEMDKRFVKSLTVRLFPHEWHGSKNRGLIGNENRVADQIRCPFLASLNCLWLDADKTKAAITQKHVVISNQAVKGVLNIIPQLQRKKEQFDLMQQALADGYRPIGLYYHLLLFDNSPEEVERRAQEVKSLYIQQNWELQDDPYIELPLLLNSLPMHLANDAAELRDRLRRMKTLPSSVAPHLLPIYSDWKGFGEPVFTCLTRCGQTFTFDVFGNTNGGYSMTISGKTGSGKSFFTNKFLLSYLGVGARVWVIDIGRSYEKLCKTIGGQYIEVRDQLDQLCFNPFSYLTYKEDHAREEQGQLLSIFERMCAPRAGLTDLQRSFLQETIQKVWMEDRQDGSPEIVARILADHHDARARDLAQMLQPYRVAGTYGSLFNGRGSLNFRDAFVVMELEGFDATPDLAQVVLLQLILSVQSQIVTLDRSIRKLCVIDEAWRYLVSGGENNAVAEFFVLGARAFRKHRGAIVTVTQGVNDYFSQKNRAGEAIWENSDFTMLFNQRADSLAALKEQKRLVITESEYDRLTTVHRFGDEYAECMMLSTMGNETLQIVVDDFTRYLFSTKPEDVARLDRYMRQEGLSLVKAIERCLREDCDARARS